MANRLNGTRRGVELPGPQGRFGMGKTTGQGDVGTKKDDPEEKPIGEATAK